MSILIRGMDMPEDCPMCPCAYFANHWTFLGCGAKPGKRYAMMDEEYRQLSTRPDWCPLVEVKTPHGRLVDADTEIKRYGLDKATKYGNKTAEEQSFSYSTMMMYEISDLFEDAPTIIEAEE